jgi:hypothetical protein
MPKSYLAVRAAMRNIVSNLPEYSKFVIARLQSYSYTVMFKQRRSSVLCSTLHLLLDCCCSTTAIAANQGSPAELLQCPVVICASCLILGVKICTASYPAAIPAAVLRPPPSRVGLGHSHILGCVLASLQLRTLQQHQQLLERSCVQQPHLVRAQPNLEFRAVWPLELVPDPAFSSES